LNGISYPAVSAGHTSGHLVVRGRELQRRNLTDGVRELFEMERAADGIGGWLVAGERNIRVHWPDRRKVADFS
jgi:hypothetical protein